MSCVSFQKNSVTSLDCCLQDNTDLQPASTLIILQCRLLEDSPRWTLQTLSMGRAPSPRCERRINATNLLHCAVNIGARPLCGSCGVTCGTKVDSVRVVRVSVRVGLSEKVHQR
ncbi:hypothetical protein CCUS01_13906 [Colletotrichum cuscutae]|uniref:Uncharacterized protein n=1 Tax=Colletotrichum cuscutae TaxID=1209917 RepID=A0AAJ0DM83_9PEZI|nr:hypothetical protein CCUS01_13906 [Colletotrichum cuscutae]